jgi:DNA-binding MarR family transcriptional regulator
MSSVSRSAVAADVGHTGPDLGWGLVTAARAFKGLAATAVDASLPGGARGYQVLQTAARGRPPSQLALARELGIDKTVMTYLLDELEEAGLIERRPDPNDRRARHIHLTDLGQRALLTSRKSISAAEDELLSALSVKEAEKFRDFVERIARASQLRPDPCPPIQPC